LNVLSYQNKTDVYMEGKLIFRDNYHLQDSGLVTVKEAMANMQVGLDTLSVLMNGCNPQT